EADRGLGGGEHDDEDGEHLPVVARVRVAGEGDVVDVGRVEHQLDAHQDADRVAPRDDGEEPEGEEDAPEHDEVAERERAHGGPYAFTSLRETTMAPTRAASRTSEAISNGSAYWRRNAFPIPYVVGAGAPGSFTTQVARRATCTIHANAMPTRTAAGSRPTARFDTFTSEMRCVSMTAKSVRTKMPPT